jgi:hypothetical protein
MDDFSLDNLAWLFEAVKPVEAAYSEPEFSFLVHQGSKGTALVASRLLLSPLATDRPDRVSRLAISMASTVA